MAAVFLVSPSTKLDRIPGNWRHYLRRVDCADFTRCDGTAVVWTCSPSRPAVHAPSCTLSGACGGDTVTLCWPCVTCRAVHGRRRALKVLVYRQRTGRGGWLCSAANNNCHYTRSHVRLCTTRCSKAPPARPQINKQVNRHIRGYIESAEQSRTAEHFWLAAYSASKSDNKPV